MVAGCVVFVVGVAHLRKKTSVCCEELVLCSWLHVGWCGAVALAVAVGVAAVVVLAVVFAVAVGVAVVVVLAVVFAVAVGVAAVVVLAGVFAAVAVVAVLVVVCGSLVVRPVSFHCTRAGLCSGSGLVGGSLGSRTVCVPIRRKTNNEQSARNGDAHIDTQVGRCSTVGDSHL
jgi:lysylphosphatidylglycerol synthetase-like protein (DUF2156 family)